jgi:hypothetical protein
MNRDMKSVMSCLAWMGVVTIGMVISSIVGILVHPFFGVVLAFAFILIIISVAIDRSWDD